MQNVLIVIPVRLGSTRFPKKCFARINGEEMLKIVAKNALETNYSVCVATPDIEVIDKVGEYALKDVFNKNLFHYQTSPNNRTGNEAVAEVAANLKEYAVIVNLQGDEPTITSEDITKAVQYKLDNIDAIINGCTFCAASDAKLTTNIKMVTNTNNELVYASRSIVPNISKNKSEGILFLKQVGLFIFNRKQSVTLYGDINKPKSKMEELEDICILRAINDKIPVKLFNISHKVQSVDVPTDLAKVERIRGQNDTCNA